jgi:hypothetical protein
MRHVTLAIAVACATSLLISACDLSTGYQGYGTFSDMGAGAATERYKVDFGPIELGKANQRMFKMSGLPPVEFTMGLRPVKPSAGCDAAALSAVSVRIDMETADGSIVIAEEGPLSTWATSSSLVYRRGRDQPAPAAGAPSDRARAGVLAAQGWGTYFTPQSATWYLVKVSVLEANVTTHCESRLVLLSSGWK